MSNCLQTYCNMRWGRLSCSRLADTCLGKLATASLLLLCAMAGVLRAEELRCERIMLGACQNLVYDMTIASAPETDLNFIAAGGASSATAGSGVGDANETFAGGAIKTWLDAERLMASLRPIIDSGCSKQALFLFCSSLFPLCSPTAPRPVHPCRSLCEQVRKDCFSQPPSSKLWPAFLDCRALPQPEKHELCMQVPSDATGSMEHAVVGTPVGNAPAGTGVAATVADSGPSAGGRAAAASLPSSAETVGRHWSISNITSLLQHATSSGAGGVPAIVRTLPGQSAAGAAMSWSERINSILLPGPARGEANATSSRTLAQPCPANHSFEYEQCVPRCGPAVDALYSQRQKELIESWTLVLSAVCFIFTFTSLVTFWAKATKLEYPDRPILFMTLCYNLLGLCYLERTILHSPRAMEVPLVPQLVPAEESTVDAVAAARGDCAITSQCLAYYILKHYLLLSASTWWLIYGLCWYLSTAKQWSCEALDRKSGLFHVLAWVVPFAAPIGALLRGNIQRFELTGFCTARGFTELPSLLLLLAGASLVCLALAALARLRLCWNQRAPHLSRVFGRVLTFAVCYLLPALSAAICMMLERVEHRIEPCPGGATECVSQQRAQGRWPPFSVLPTAIRLALTLLGGGFVGLWLWSRQITSDGALVGASKASAFTVAYPACAAARDLSRQKRTKAQPLKSISILTGAGEARLGAAGGTNRQSGYADDQAGYLHTNEPLLGGGNRKLESACGSPSRGPGGGGGGGGGCRTSRGTFSIDRSDAKGPKYSHVYRSGGGSVPRSAGGSRTLSPDGADSQHSNSERHFQCLNSGDERHGVGTSGTRASGREYMPVRVHRSLRPGTVSMITRI